LTYLYEGRIGTKKATEWRPEEQMWHGHYSWG